MLNRFLIKHGLIVWYVWSWHSDLVFTGWLKAANPHVIYAYPDSKLQHQSQVYFTCCRFILENLPETSIIKRHRNLTLQLSSRWYLMNEWQRYRWKEKPVSWLIDLMGIQDDDPEPLVQHNRRLCRICLMYLTGAFSLNLSPQIHNVISDEENVFWMWIPNVKRFHWDLPSAAFGIQARTSLNLTYVSSSESAATTWKTSNKRKKITLASLWLSSFILSRSKANLALHQSSEDSLSVDFCFYSED